MAPCPLNRDPEPLARKVTWEGYRPPSRSGQCCLLAGKIHKSQGKNSRGQGARPSHPSLTSSSSRKPSQLPPGAGTSLSSEPLAVLSGAHVPPGSVPYLSCIFLPFPPTGTPPEQGWHQVQSHLPLGRWTGFAGWTGDMVRLSQTQRVGQGVRH